MKLLVQVISPNDHVISDYSINSQSITKVIRKVEDLIIKVANLDPFNRILLMNTSIDSYTYVKITPYNINFKHTGFYLCNINDKEPEYKFIGDHIIDIIQIGYSTIKINEYIIKISTHKDNELVNYKRLVKLQKHLYSLKKAEESKEKIFDFNYFNVTKGYYRSIKNDWLEADEEDAINNCKTIGCAAGELPAIDKNWKFRGTPHAHFSNLYYKVDRKDTDTTEDLMEYFNLSRDLVDVIFYPAGARRVYNEFLEEYEETDRFIKDPKSFVDVADNIKVLLTHFGLFSHFNILN